MLRSGLVLVRYAGQAKWGIEIDGLAAIDLDNHTAFLLETFQTFIEDKCIACSGFGKNHLDKAHWKKLERLIEAA